MNANAAKLICDPLDTNPLRLLAARALLRTTYICADLACRILPQNHPTRTFMLGRTERSRDAALDSLRGPRDLNVVTGAVGLVVVGTAAAYDLIALTPIL